MIFGITTGARGVPRSAWRRILCLAVLFVGGLLLVIGCRHAPLAAEAQSFRLMTYNIHHAEGIDGKIDVLRIAQVIQREKADIVALQEVDKGVERTARRDLAAEIAELAGMSSVFSNNFAFQGGQYGNALLTRFPVLRATNAHYAMLREGEQRGLLQVVLRVHGRELVVMNTHIDHRPDDSERFLNTGAMAANARLYGARPLLLCGDFNDQPSSRVYAKLSETFADTWLLAGVGEGFTFSSAQPRRRIDYIWCSKGDGLVPRKVWVASTDASDHLPLVAEFTWR
jgi:endonuclease/exonuclease/phosphatase family metal-dependent hydrolase